MFIYYHNFIATRLKLFFRVICYVFPDVRLKQLLEEGREPFAGATAGDSRVTGHARHGRGVVRPRGSTHLNLNAAKYTK